VLRPVSRQVFRPVPNVDSVLLGLTRTGLAAGPALSALVHGAFAHRRKTLAGSLALATAGSATGAIDRERVRAALTELGHPPDARAERLSPPELRALSESLAR
jgi:16S rRNA (adenine1518-N6/adenine1519-N6)-dimethyltransferase